MRRALDQYGIGGIRTTIPFFKWLLTTDDFAAARFDTTMLDAEPASRAGRPFLEPAPELEELAVMAAALETFTASTRQSALSTPTAAGSAWRQAARRDALR